MSIVTVTIRTVLPYLPNIQSHPKRNYGFRGFPHNGTMECVFFKASHRQVEDLHALGEWAYIATDACIFKTLDEEPVDPPRLC